MIMGLFFDVLSSINNPDQNGSVAQLETIMGTVQTLAKTQGIDTTQMQAVLSSAGGLLGPLLQQQQSNLPGEVNLGNLMGQISGGGAPATALQSLFPPQMQEQLIQGISQQTGMNASMLQSLIPSLLPVITGLLSMGGGKAGANPLLGAFINGGSGADLGEVFKFADRFLNPT
jgi:hypothetical protein